jgi:LCP family protein required for cell wall assembly
MDFNSFLTKWIEKIRSYPNWLQTVLLPVMLVFVFLIAATLMYVLLTIKDKGISFPQKKVASVFNSEVKKGDDIKNILLIGHGGVGHSGGGLADTILVLRIDSKAKKAFLISVPRDTWVEIPVDGDKTQSFKINNSYAIGVSKSYSQRKEEFKREHGGGNLAKYVVGNLLGFDIDYYLAIDFNQFQKMIDSINGIEVDVPITFDDYFYPVRGLENETCGMSAAKIAELHKKYSGFELEKQFECRYEHIHFDKGTQRMTGTMALKFVRSRHSSQHGGDFARSERQMAVLKGVEKKLISIDAVANIDALFESLSYLVVTDLNPSVIKDMASVFGKAEDYDIAEIRLNEDNVLASSRGPGGQFILVPKDGNMESIKNFVASQLDE